MNVEQRLENFTLKIAQSTWWNRGLIGLVEEGRQNKNMSERALGQPIPHREPVTGGKVLRNLLFAAMAIESLDAAQSVITHQDIAHMYSLQVLSALVGGVRTDTNAPDQSHVFMPTEPPAIKTPISVYSTPTATAERPTIQAPTSAPTITITSEATTTPEQANFKFCEISTVKHLKDIQDQCTIPFDQLGNIDGALAAYSQPFDASKFKSGVYITDAQTFIMYGTGAGYFKKDTEQPYRLGLVAYSETTFMFNGTERKMDFLILPIEVPDPNNPQKTKWVKGILTFPSDMEKNGQLRYLLGLWMKNGPIIYENPYFAGINNGTNPKNPVSEKTFNTHPDMAQRFAATASNDNLNSLTDPDIIVEVTVGR